MDYYHVLNRGVEKRDIVLTDDDRMRFVRSLYVFNDNNPAPNAVSQPSTRSRDYKREQLVYIHSWCLMNNHYHLLLSPLNGEVENVSKFIKKLNGGYAKFFNEKYERAGALWQGKTKKILINRDSHFKYIPYYIHLNPLDYSFPKWRSGDVSQVSKAFATLETYRWSSYLDYIGTKNFPSLIDTKILSDVCNTPPEQRRVIQDIISGNTTLSLDPMEIE